MSKIVEMLNKIKSWGDRHKNNGYSKVEPGLTMREIDEIVSEYDFKLPQEIIELYLWGNGGGFHNERFYELSFYSLEDAVEKVQYKDFYSEEDSEYILFIGGQEDCYLWTDVKTEYTEIAFIYYNDEPTSSPIYPSFTAMLESIMENLEIN